MRDPQYVNEILDRLTAEHPEIHRMILYVEQPFPYELERERIDVRSVASRKPLFWMKAPTTGGTSVWAANLAGRALPSKPAKPSAARCSACWAQAHGMSLMVQDLTNPMLAQISHVGLAAHVPTIKGVETNSMQFYPEASAPEAAIHPGIFGAVTGGCISGRSAAPEWDIACQRSAGSFRLAGWSLEVRTNFDGGRGSCEPDLSSEPRLGRGLALPATDRIAKIIHSPRRYVDGETHAALLQSTE